MDNLRQPGAYCGLRNGGATCYMNAVLQQLYMQPKIRELVLGAWPVPPEQQADSLSHQLQVSGIYLLLKSPRNAFASANITLLTHI